MNNEENRHKTTLPNRIWNLKEEISHSVWNGNWLIEDQDLTQQTRNVEFA